MNPSTFASPPADACTQDVAGTSGPDRITRTHIGVRGVYMIEKGIGTPLQQPYVRYSYTINGKLGSVTDANGNAASMSYDGHDRLSRWIFPSKTVAGTIDPADYEEYGYDAAGNRTSLRKRDGKMLTYNYDALNRMISKIIPDGGVLTAAQTRDVYYDYDNRGLQLNVRFDSLAGQGMKTTFDNAGRTLSSRINLNSVSRPLAYTWDKNSNRTRVAHPDTANYFSYAYDLGDRLASVQEFNSATNLLATFAFDQQGRRANLQKGVASTTGVAITSYGYDAASRLNSLSDNLANTAEDTATSFTYNLVSQIASRTRSNTAYSYVNEAGGLPSFTRSYAVNGLNQYTSTSSAAFGYDSNGNVTSSTDSLGTTSYVYDVENRLVSATSPSGSVGLAYDTLGRLWQMTAGVNVTTFLYDGDELVAEYAGNATTPLSRYVHGAGSDDPIVQYQGQRSHLPTAAICKATIWAA